MEYSFRERILQALAISTISAATLSACTNLSDNIQEFDAAASNTTRAMESLYTGANNYRRTMALMRRKYLPWKEIVISDDDGHATDEGERYKNSYIAVRIQALQALNQYADELALLAGSDAPEQAAQQLELIGNSISDISSNVSSLAGDTSINASKYSAPITHIAALATQIALNFKKKEFVRRAVLESRSNVDACCDYLQDDFNEMYQTDYINVTDATLAKAIKYWNDNGASLPNSERWTVLADVTQLSDKYYDLKHSQLFESLTAVRKMFDDLSDKLDKNKSEKEATASAILDAHHFIEVASRIQDHK